MATITTTTTPTVTSVTTSWLKQHERLVCLALILAFGCFGVNKYFDHESTVKQAQATAAAQVSAADHANSLALASQSAQIAAQYASLVQTLSAENASLNASMTQRQAAQKTQVNVDTNLPMAGVSARWSVLLPMVTPSTPLTGGLSLTAQQAHDTLAYIEEVPTCHENLGDETRLAANYKQEVEKSDLLATDLNSQILGLQKENADLVAKDVADVKACKARERKSKITWIKRALAIGFGLGLYAGAHGF